MDELSLDNILSEDQINGLFSEEIQETEAAPSDTPEVKNKEKEETTEVNPEELFMDKPESVGSEGNIKEEEDTGSTQGNTSPNFYSSIATALVEDGIFQNLDDEVISKIKTADDFAELISNQIREQFDERQKRVDEALNYGVEPSEIQKHENLLKILDNVTEEKLSNENDEGENLRKNLIYQDYINRGFSRERALREVERSIKAGTDIEDAREALQSNKEFYSESYKKLLQEAKDKNSAEEKKLKEQSEKLKASILDEKKAFGELDLDRTTRQKVYDSIMKPVYTDPETGEKLTAIQKYELENRAEFLKNVGLMYVLTDGFKKLDGLVQGKVKKELKKGLRELEHTLNNTSRNSDGSFKFISGVGDPDSKSSKWDLDI